MKRKDRSTKNIKINNNNWIIISMSGLVKVRYIVQEMNGDSSNNTKNSIELLIEIKNYNNQNNNKNMSKYLINNQKKCVICYMIISQNLKKKTLQNI